MTCKSSCRTQESNSLDGEELERSRIVAAFMGLLVEQSIKKLDFSHVAARADVSVARLREELGSTIAVLAAHVERIDRLVLAGGDVVMAEPGQGLAMLLTAVLRTWLDGEDPDLARAMSALDRAGAWAAPCGLPRPGLSHSGLRLPPAHAATGRGHGGESGLRRDLLQTSIAQGSRTRYCTKRDAAPLNRPLHEPSSCSTLMRPKRPLDANQLGKWIADLSTGVAEDDPPTVASRATEVLGRKGGLKGGKARAAALTPERRREIAQLAAQTRWRSTKRHP
jgi:hypothetical protein